MLVTNYEIIRDHQYEVMENKTRKVELDSVEYWTKDSDGTYISHVYVLELRREEVFKS